MKPGKPSIFNVGIGKGAFRSLSPASMLHSHASSRLVGYSVEHFIKVCAKVTNKTIPIEYGPLREGDPGTIYANSSAVQHAIGWKPRFVDLTEALNTAWQWQVAHPTGYDNSRKR